MGGSQKDSTPEETSKLIEKSQELEINSDIEDTIEDEQTLDELTKAEAGSIDDLHGDELEAQDLGEEDAPDIEESTPEDRMRFNVLSALNRTKARNRQTFYMFLLAIGLLATNAQAISGTFDFCLDYTIAWYGEGKLQRLRSQKEACEKAIKEVNEDIDEIQNSHKRTERGNFEIDPLQMKPLTRFCKEEEKLVAKLKEIDRELSKREKRYHDPKINSDFFRKQAQKVKINF